MKAFILSIMAVAGTVGLLVMRCRMSEPAYLQTITSGNFHNVAHRGSGTAAIVQRRDGVYVLELNHLETELRPDLWVYLVTAADARENESVVGGGMLPVAPLPPADASDGIFRFALPTSFDPVHYRAVTIWSQKYQVNFTTAPLRQPEANSLLRCIRVSG